MFRVLGVYNFDTYVNVFHKPGSKILRGILSPSWDSKERPTSVANKQIFTLLVLIKDSNTYVNKKNRTHFSQCPRTDLNKRFLPRPKTTTA